MRLEETSQEEEDDGSRTQEDEQGVGKENCWGRWERGRVGRREGGRGIRMA